VIPFIGPEMVEALRAKQNFIDLPPPVLPKRSAARQKTSEPIPSPHTLSASVTPTHESPLWGWSHDGSSELLKRKRSFEQCKSICTRLPHPEAEKYLDIDGLQSCYSVPRTSIVWNRRSVRTVIHDAIRENAFPMNE
jgi:hypothetical protein